MIGIFSLLGTLLFMFAVSFLIHHFMGFMGLADGDSKDIQPVEVVNFSDISLRR